jgi:hypothetical protein
MYACRKGTTCVGRYLMNDVIRVRCTRAYNTPRRFLILEPELVPISMGGAGGSILVAAGILRGR